MFLNIKTANARDVVLMAGEFGQLGYFGWQLWRLLRGRGRGSRVGAAGKPRPLSDGGESGGGNDLESRQTEYDISGGGGSGSDQSGGAGAALDAATRRQLLAAALSSVALVVVYNLFFSYPVRLLRLM